MRFEDYVAARGQALVRFAYVLTGDGNTAEDVVQAALADAYRHWRKVTRADHPDAYVRRIVVNTYLGSQRRRSSGELPMGDDLAAVVDDRSADRAPDHADAVVDRDASRGLLRGLPPRARAVLVLRFYVDLDDVTIGDLLGVAPSTVRATASRALATLRQRHDPRQPQAQAAEESP
jgi:RNA polymerase sigma-70 factor (sigma-E family)